MDRGTARGYVALKVEDPDQTRFTGTQYTNVINQAQQQFCIDTRAYKQIQTIVPVAGTSEYTLNTDIVDIDLIRFAGLKLVPTTKYILSYGRGSDWQAATGTPTAYLIDELNSQLWLVAQPDAAAVATAAAATAANVIVDYSGIAADIADGAANDMTVLFGNRALLQPYTFGIISFAAYLLSGYQTQAPEWALKRASMLKEYERYRDQAIEKYANMADLPLRLQGGRIWADRVLNPSNNAFSG